MDKKVFIGGPITNLMTENGFDSGFKEMVMNIKQLFEKKGYQVLSAHLYEAFGDNRIEPDEMIVKRDLGWIKEAGLCVFLFPVGKDNLPVRTDGTLIELGFAAYGNSEIIVFWDSSHAANYSPMFRGMTYQRVQMYDFVDMKGRLDEIV